MRFDRWHRLQQVPLATLRGPGVFQVRRQTGLVEYPRGRSAMVHYGAGNDLGVAIAAFVDQFRDRPWLLRTSHEPVAEPEAALTRLLADFRDRFGAEPHP